MGLSGETKQLHVAILAALLNYSSICAAEPNRIWLMETKKPIKTPTSMPTFYPTEYPTIPLLRNTNIDPTGKPTLIVVDESTSVQTPADMQTSNQNSQLSSHPAISPSRKPSMKPSTPPFASSSAAPSQSLSTSPSGAPSLTYSTIPTSLPSLFPSSIPSKSANPSVQKSDGPSASASPSSVPSSMPTQYPSAKHSDGPSQMPSKTPSEMPSRIPTQNPTMSSRPTESISPSSSPSHSLSITLSGLPSASGLPTFEPSTVPSDMPSLTPSTSGPSSSPSAMPSGQPSNIPSLYPSQSPSTIPSSSPTLTCHDKADYRSPINGLTCLDHTGTDCYQWRNIGLNTSALGDLINNCPETCNIPCGSFLDFSIPVSYQLTGLPGLLDDLSKLSLEQVSFDYIIDYVADASEKIFELDNVELNSQSFAIQERLRRRNLLQVNQQTSQRIIRKEIVVVTVVFDGFSIGLGYDTISQLLVSGIKNTGFALALQGSDPFFKKAVISSAAETKDTSVHEPVDEERDGPSSATVLVSILSVIGLVTALMFAIANRERLEEWWKQKRLERFQSTSSSLGTSSSQPGRPRIVSIDMIARGVPESNFDRAVSRMKTIMARLRPSASGKLQKMFGASSPKQNSSSQASRLSHQGSPNNVASLLSFDRSTHTDNATASNSIRRLITSITPTVSKSSTEPDDSSGSFEKEEKQIDPLHISSPMSEVTEESNQPEHPLSKVIPPMIVIDNIDDATAGEVDKKTEPNMVPGKCVQASTEIKSALIAQSTVPVMMFNFPELNAWQHYDEVPRSLSPLGLVMDSESEAGTSCTSTPANSVTQKAELSRFGALGGHDFEADDPGFSPLHLLAMQSSSSTENTFDFAADAADDVSIELMARQPSSEENSAHDRVGLINSIWAMSPSSAMKETLISTKKAASAKANIFKRRFSNSSDTPGVVDRNEIPREECNRFMFEAPRTSKLGLEIDSRDDSGPIVHAVKDYSPLFGQIKTGDKICEIDGRDQQGSNPKEVMQLLSAKHRRRVSSGSMKIVVERLASASKQSPKPRNDNNFHYSSEAMSNQNYEDVDNMISSMLRSHNIE